MKSQKVLKCLQRVKEEEQEDEEEGVVNVVMTNKTPAKLTLLCYTNMY